jgi:hypothetical protein
MSGKIRITDLGDAPEVCLLGFAKDVTNDADFQKKSCERSQKYRRSGRHGVAHFKR